MLGEGLGKKIEAKCLVYVVRCILRNIFSINMYFVVAGMKNLFCLLSHYYGLYYNIFYNLSVILLRNYLSSLILDEREKEII